MEYLTEKNISEITTLIRAKGVEMEELLYDLVDHTCCMIEEKMEQGLNYTSALEESMSSFGNNGIRKIQEETTYLLTKNILVMRKTMHITGISAALLLLLGSIFKIQHLPGAGIIYILGGVMLCFLFMPLFLAVRIKEKAGKLNTWTNILGVVSALGLCFGILFKIMHWPFANILMNTGGIFLLLVFLPLFLYNSYKNKNLKTATVVPIIISIAGFSLMFSLVSLRNSRNVDNAILNIQYTINSDTKQVNQLNQLLWKDVSDSSKTEAMNRLNDLAKQINESSSALIFDVAKSQYPDITDENMTTILKEDLYQISYGKTNLEVLRTNERLQELLSLITSFQRIYKEMTGVQAGIDMNQANMDHYLNAEHPMFPLGIVIRDISYMNLQVQKTHTSFLQYVKGRVS